MSLLYSKTSAMFEIENFGALKGMLNCLYFHTFVFLQSSGT
jgi:hypothetical protein